MKCLRRLGWRSAVLGAVAGIPVLYAAGAALVVPERLLPADLILVLGGDGPPRAARAAALFQAGLAPRVLVSGRGDCIGIRDALVADEVPAGSITLECASSSTYENATLSAPLLGRLQPRRVLLATSWFHLRRALACFALAAPGIVWLPAPATPPPSGFITTLASAGAVVTEAPKLLWYALRYRVRP